MMKKLRDHRGAVAVFLVLVLVPMITCSALFVEVARVKLAQSVVASSGDLALNTVLTKYDYNLNDFYGMLGSAQDTSDVLSSIEDYFVAGLKSQDVDTTYLQKYIKSIKGMFKESDDITDLLKITIPDGGFSIAPTKDGALDNPALIKTQIVDFMKYRSPANAAMALLSSLTSMNKEVEQIPDQTECADKQQDFYDTEEDLLETAKQAYDKMQSYMNLNITRQYVEGLTQNIKNYETDYKIVHVKYTFDLAGTQNLKAFSKKSVTIADKVTKHSDSNHASWGDTKGLIISMADAIERFAAANTRLKSVDQGNPFSEGTYKTRYYLNVMKELNTNNQYAQFISEANKMSATAEKLKNAYEFMEEVDESKRYIDLAVRTGVNTSGKKTIDDHYESLISQYEKLVREDIKGLGGARSVFQDFGNRLQGIYDNISPYNDNNLPNPPSNNPNGNITRDPADNRIKGVYNEITGYYNKVKDGIKYVDDAVGKLKSVKKKIAQYKEDYDEWKAAASKSSLDGNSFATASRNDINNREKDPDVMKNLTETKVQALIDRLNNIKSALGQIKKVLEDFKYNGKKILEIKNLSDFESATNIQLNKIGKFATQIREYADSSFANAFTKGDLNLGISDANNPSLNVNTPEVYTWMKKKFDNAQSNGKYTEKEAKQKQKDFKKAQSDEMGDENESGSSSASKKEIKDQSGLPSKGSAAKAANTKKSTDLSSMTSFISTLFGDMGKTLSNAGTTLRDDLYTVDYIMSMFSYDTYDKEGKLQLWRQDGHADDKITLTTDFQSAYKDKWESKEKTDTYNKSLTNKLINSESCFSYGNEVEYILYGKSNTANKASAYGTIYMIRLALDIAPVFGKWFDDTIVSSIATSVSACSLGVIPEVVVRFAITLGLLFAEAAVDLAYIKKGIGVKLLKKEDELFVSFSEAGGIGKDGKNGATGDAFPCLQYSDYLKLLLFISLLSTKKANGIYARTADVIQVNINKITGGQAGKDGGSFLMSNAQVYYTLDTSIRVTPLLLGVPMIDSELENIKKTEQYRTFDTSNWNTFRYTETRGY